MKGHLKNMKRLGTGSFFFFNFPWSTVALQGTDS